MGLVKDLFKGDKVIWIIFLFLCLISIIEVFSAASTLTYKSGDHWAPIRQHSTYLMVGFVIVVLVHKIPSKWFRAAPFFLLPLSAALLLFVAIMGAAGGRVNGAARWTNIFGIQFQPSEIAKMAVIIITAFILSRFQEEKKANAKAFKYIIWCTGVVLLLIAPENASTAALLFGVVFLMMILGRVPWRQLAKLIVSISIVLTLFVGIIMLTPTQKYRDLPMMHRVETWQNRIKGFFEDKGAVPAAKFDIDKDAQIAHANIAIASSNIVGKMPGNSIQRDFLSQAFSDFIFAIIIEELGLLGGGFVVILYIWLLIRAGRVARKCEKSFSAFLIMGIALLLVSQAMLNMMVAVGLFPVTGQPLPLISKGGTSTLINCAYIGMILSVSREINERQEAEEAALAAQNIEQEKAKNLLNIAINMANQPEGNETKNAPTENADAPVENDRTTEGNFST
ncbi:FtsW/RodA/SpoVE family cell cycle protein [Phocaeicola abscessus]|uniref:FtsW/RodA/SpoVE family cell cycle protein n=1 Tax=Phocaeicola abscessus TaxID=555313 RepID=UPI0004AF27D4|nr:FtsW/RodA/SpoVE family cell cycle protein [Phocaeicola abscessus]